MTLQKQFEFVSVTQIVRINRKFYAASMKEGADLMQHLTHMTSLAEQFFFFIYFIVFLSFTFFKK